MGREFLPWNDLSSGYRAPATQLRFCVGPWVCVDWIWKQWALHAPHATTGPLRPRGPDKVAWGTYWSRVMGTLGPERAPKWPSRCSFIFCKPGTRVKAACRTKRGPFQNFSTLFLSFIESHSALGWVLSCFWGSWSTNWALSALRWAPLVWYILLFLFLFFLIRDFGSLPKK